MELYTILDKQACTLNISERNKEAVLERIAEIAATSEALAGINQKDILEKLSEREAQGSTGFGEGIAIPHARIPGMKKSLLFIITSRRGAEFQSVDHKKVNVFFVLLGPEDAVTEHLQILAALSRLIASTRIRREILSARTSDAIYETFVRHTRISEDDHTSSARSKKLMTIILYMQEVLYDILEFIMSQGIEGATIIESNGMGEYISNIPIFASFIDFMNADKNKSQTILLLVPEDLQDTIVNGIEKITGDLDKKDGAMIIIQDISFYKGTMKMM
ncbi:PTS sugar transporter subunit IIA [candidate division KSB1 bacterium]|nr:PTS sugar transporter subunit IIA [candidate division KSB1 bacterium]